MSCIGLTEDPNQSGGFAEAVTRLANKINWLYRQPLLCKLDTCVYYVQAMQCCLTIYQEQDLAEQMTESCNAILPVSFYSLQTTVT